MFFTLIATWEASTHLKTISFCYSQLHQNTKLMAVTCLDDVPKRKNVMSTSDLGSCLRLASIPVCSIPWETTPKSPKQQHTREVGDVRSLVPGHIGGKPPGREGLDAVIYQPSNNGSSIPTKRRTYSREPSISKLGCGERSIIISGKEGRVCRVGWVKAAIDPSSH
jgi:hypothetical protein